MWAFMRIIWRRCLGSLGLLRYVISICSLTSYPDLITLPQEKDGSYTFDQPGSLSAPHPLLYPPQTVGPLVRLLINHPKTNINLLGCSELISWEDFYKLWSEVTGIKSNLVQNAVDARDAAMPGGLGREASESMSWSAEFGWWGEGLVVPWEVDPGIKGKLMGMREFMEMMDWKPVLNNAVVRE